MTLDVGGTSTAFDFLLGSVVLCSLDAHKLSQRDKNLVYSCRMGYQRKSSGSAVSEEKVRSTKAIILTNKTEVLEVQSALSI